jgi:hypothetical protein
LLQPQGRQPAAGCPARGVVIKSRLSVQVEVLVIMGHLFRRTLVMPDHLTSSMDHLHAFGRQQLADFFDFRDLSTWVPVITMQEYLDVRCAVSECGSAMWRESGLPCLM